MRGLQLDWQNGFKIDGLPYIGYGITMPYDHFERVELLKGLSGFMYGFGTPGGVVNYVTKKPTDTPVRSIDVGFRSSGIWSEHVDPGGRFGPDQMFGYRFNANATHEEGQARNAGSINRDTLSLALDARLTRDLTCTFETTYQKRRALGQLPSIYTASYTGTSLPATISARAARCPATTSTCTPTCSSTPPACATSSPRTGRCRPPTASARPRAAATKARCT